MRRPKRGECHHHPEPSALRGARPVTRCDSKPRNTRLINQVQLQTEGTPAVNRRINEFVGIKPRTHRLIVRTAFRFLFLIISAGAAIAATQDISVTQDQHARPASDPTPNRKLQKKLHVMSKRYKLSPNQVQSISATFLEEERQLSLLAANRDLKSEERITQRRAAQDAARQKVVAVLDETQRAKYLKDLSEEQAEDDIGDPDGPPPPPPPGDGGGSPGFAQEVAPAQEVGCLHKKGMPDY